MATYPKLVVSPFYALLLLSLCSMNVMAESGVVPLYQVDVPCVIKQSGSYIVAENISGTTVAQSAISVLADDVTIDLGGNTVGGTLFGAAIYQAATNHNLVVENGYVMRGINANGNGNRFRNISVYNGLSDGILSGAGSIVENCTFKNNDLQSASGAIIHVGDGSQITDCSMVSNSGLSHLYGIIGGNGVTIERCQLSDGYVSNKVTAIEVGDGCIMNEVSINNFHAHSWSNSISINAGNNAIISNCKISGAVHTGTGSIITDCALDDYVSDQNRSYLGLNYDRFNHSAGDGSLITENNCDGTAEHPGLSYLDINNGSLMLDNGFKSTLSAGNGSMVAETFASDSIVSYDCFLIDNLFYFDLTLTNSCNRIDSNQFYGEGRYTVFANGNDNLIIRNRFISGNSASIQDGSDDHIGRIIKDTEITSDQPWANYKNP